MSPSGVNDASWHSQMTWLLRLSRCLNFEKYSEKKIANGLTQVSTGLVFKVSIGKSHNQMHYMPLLAPDDVLDSHIDTLEPIHQMDMINIS